MTDNENKEPERAGKWSQAIIEIESIIYSLAIFVLMLPVYICLYGYKTLKWFGTALLIMISAIAASLLLPVYGSIIMVLAFVFSLIVIGLERLCIFLRWIYAKFYVMWKGINWCAVRSAIRIISVICFIGAVYTIFDCVMKLPPGTQVITGKFFDSNGMIFLIHEAIALLMISITMFYNAWAYSKDEEVTFICKNTVGLSMIKSIKDKILGK